MAPSVVTPANPGSGPEQAPGASPAKGGIEITGFQLFAKHFSFLKNRKSPFIPLFQRGKEWKESSSGCRKALLPLKKGGGRDFWQGLFKGLK
jgi:hypothetical protein